MFKKIKAQSGDVLLYKSKGDIVGFGIGFFSNLGRLFSQGGKYVHAAIYIGSGRVIQSHLNVEKRYYVSGARESGVHISIIPEDEYPYIDIYRMPKGLKKGQIIEVIRWTRGQLGKKYDLAAFPSSFFRSVIARIFGWKMFSKSRPLLNDPERWFCSELVSSAYEEACGIKLVPSIHPMSQTPSDLGSNKSILQRIF